MRYIVISGLASLAAGGLLWVPFGAENAGQTAPKQVPYTWKSVQIVGGGFVDGLIFHPTTKGVAYARTDMGGAYRWDDQARQWHPILDWMPFKDLNLMGVESIALDPHDSKRVYLACGTYTNATTPNGAILRSADGAKSFQITRVPFKFGGNENGRGNGERMRVDPQDGRIVFLGTRHDGLWKSSDRGAAWHKVESFPWVAHSNPGDSYGGANGIVSVLFDPNATGHSARPGRTRSRATQTIYVAASTLSENGLFRSNDGGVTWSAVPGQPTQWRLTRMVLARDGTLYVSYGSSPGPSPMRDGAVWKLNTHTGEWTDVTPDRPDPNHDRAFGYAAVSVQADDPRRLIVSSFYRPGGEEIFRSIDAGRSWKPIFHGGGGTYDFSIAPYVARTPIHWLFDIEIDPSNPDHALFTTGYGGYETFNLSDVDRGKPTKWSVMSRGIEETVPLELLSPPAGAHLISAIGDYGGFVHWDLDNSPGDGNFDHPHFGNTTGIACAESRPSMIVRVGQASGNRGGGNIGYSLDFGHSWQTTPATPPNGRSGRIAVSADGSTWIWTLRSGAYWTRDMGATWTQCSGLPANASRVVADKVNSRKFYCLALFDGILYVSNDSGASFESHRFALGGGLPKPGGDRMDGRAGQDQIYATPGREGDLWIAAFDGLHHSWDGGATFLRNPEVQELHAFGFGKGLATGRRGEPYPALYMIGTVGGVRGIFRSDDAGTHWVRINDDQHQWGLLLQIAGDPRIYGRVYVGGHGRGVSYGDPR